MDTSGAPQIIEHLTRSLQFTPYDIKWIPGTAKFTLCGQPPKANGIIEIIQLNKSEMKTVAAIEHTKGVKCSTYGASQKAELAFGDFGGKLNIIDIETRKVLINKNIFFQIFYSVNAHEQLINCIDGFGGQEIGYGAPELVTGGRDGCVRVWDPRQKSPVISLEPLDKDVVPDAWCVSFGNSYNNDERVIACGYDNGDVKLFDLRKNQLIWDTNLKNGVCGIEFDRKDIQMNKIVATTLESKIHVFDLRTYHPTQGYAGMQDVGQKSTIWGVKHLPQNRDIFATLGGNGALNLYKYSYPSQRQITDAEGKLKGVVGKIEILNGQEICQQPIASFDWNKDKLGLAVLCGLDQTVKVVIVTKLNNY